MQNLAAQIFLARFFILLEKGKVIFDPRNNKTIDFLFEQGMTVDDVFLIIRKLTSNNFYEGPEKDRNGSPGDVMKFLYNYKGIRIYIKLKIIIDNINDIGAIMSFHKEGMYD